MGSSSFSCAQREMIYFIYFRAKELNISLNLYQINSILYRIQKGTFLKFNKVLFQNRILLKENEIYFENSQEIYNSLIDKSFYSFEIIFTNILISQKLPKELKELIDSLIFFFSDKSKNDCLKLNQNLTEYKRVQSIGINFIPIWFFEQ